MPNEQHIDEVVLVVENTDPFGLIGVYPTTNTLENIRNLCTHIRMVHGAVHYDNDTSLHDYEHIHATACAELAKKS